MTALRAQAMAALAALPTRRRPALRRPDAPDALLSTDLPFIADADAVADFTRALTEAGWRVWPQNGWLLLDAPVPVPDAPLPGDLQGECGCCISLLLRHREDAPAQAIIRAVVKAAEAGAIPLERCCMQLHGEFAARLRQHQPLPGGLLPYLCKAHQLLT